MVPWVSIIERFHCLYKQIRMVHTTNTKQKQFNFLINGVYNLRQTLNRFFFIAYPLIISVHVLETSEQNETLSFLNLNF